MVGHYASQTIDASVPEPMTREVPALLELQKGSLRSPSRRVRQTRIFNCINKAVSRSPDLVPSSTKRGIHLYKGGGLLLLRLGEKQLR